MNSRKKIILIVDDSEFDRQLLDKALTIKGDFETIQAVSGEECLRIIADQSVDLVLMDILMPGLCGTEVLQKIRETHNPIQLPIIMVTARVEAADLVACLRAGANDYITKPLNFEIAVSRIFMHLDLVAMSEEMSRLRGVIALDMVIASHHQAINNSLGTALGYLESADMSDPAAKEKVKDALWKIADSLKSISAAGDKKEQGYKDGFDPFKVITLTGDCF
jgi:DNA-binding response OmpR family regulator